MNLHRIASAETVPDSTDNGSAARERAHRPRGFAFAREVNPERVPGRSYPSWPWWRWALTGLSAVALMLSLYLGWHSVVGGSVLGCGGGSPCNKVLSSRWSSIGGILPVSGLAAAAYLTMLVASLNVGPGSEASERRLAWRTMLVLVGAAAGSAVWFIIVQKWIIGAFCLYCTATHITGLLLTALVMWRSIGRSDENRAIIAPANPAPSPCVRAAVPVTTLTQTTPRNVSHSWPAIGFFLAGLGLAGITATSQAVFTPPAAYIRGQSQNTPPALDPHSVPLLGSPEAPYIVKLLFDYKCPHCQQLHFLLNEAIRRSNGKLAFVLCPTPLNRQCNSYVPRDVEEFKDSCELAKIGLAIWVAKRDAFTAFDHWMFSFESGDRWEPRTLAAAKAKAIEMVGHANFDAAWADSWIDRYMRTSIRIYGQTIQNGNGAVPKLVFGSRWVIPEPNDADDLVRILQNSLAVPRPDENLVTKGHGR